MTTDVSSSPRSGRSPLGMGDDDLIGRAVEVVAKLVVVDGRCGSEEFDGGFGAYGETPGECQPVSSNPIQSPMRGLMVG